MRRLATGFGLIEGPVYDPARGLLFSDVIGGGVYCLDAQGAVIPVIAHRKGIGGMARHAEGGLVVSGRNVAYKPPDREAETQVLLQGDPGQGILGFNDLTTDAAGRVYVGSLGFRATDTDAEAKPGFLYMLDLDGTAHVLGGEILLSNGLAVSPEGDRLYQCDTRANCIWLYELRPDGRAGPRRTLFREEGFWPDGMALSEDGALWVADARGGAVRCFEPEGRERGRLPVPLPMVTSVCFGGAGLKELYVVTGSHGAAQDNAGSIFIADPGVAGLPVSAARVRLPG